MQHHHDAIEYASNELEMYNYVTSMYSADVDLLMNGKLLFIQRKENQMWEPPSDTSLQVEVRGTDTEAIT